MLPGSFFTLGWRMAAAAAGRSRPSGQPLLPQSGLHDLHSEFLKGPSVDLFGFEPEFVEKATGERVALQIRGNTGCTAQFVSSSLRIAGVSTASGIVFAFRIVAGTKLHYINHSKSPLSCAGTLGRLQISWHQSTKRNCCALSQSYAFHVPPFCHCRRGRTIAMRKTGRLPGLRRACRARRQSQPSFSKSETPCLQMGQM